MATAPALEEIGADVFGLSLPIPFENGQINIFLFADGSEVDLIDCGINDGESFERIRQAVTYIGGDRARVRKVLVTHVHRDHYGGIGALSAEYRCFVLMHRLESPVVQAHYFAPDSVERELESYLSRNGMTHDLQARAREEDEVIRKSVEPARPSIELDGAETLRFGRRDLQLVWTPGHSPGHLCAFESETGMLFCGDLAPPGMTPNVGLHPQSTPNPLDDFFAALETVTALDPSTVYPAHGEPYADLPRRAAELEAHHSKRRADIAARLGGGPRTAWELASSIWTDGARSRPYHNRLALQETLAHLQSLAVSGLITKRLGDDLTKWHVR